MIKILLGNSRIGGEFFGKSLGKKLGRDPFYPNVAGKGVHALKRKEQHTVGHLFAHTLDFAQLLLRLLKGKVGPHGKRNLAACHLFCRVHKIFHPKSRAQRGKILGRHGRNGLHVRKGVFAVRKRLSVPFAKAPYYALYAGDVVILGNDEGAERLKRLLIDNMYAGGMFRRLFKPRIGGENFVDFFIVPA